MLTLAQLQQQTGAVIAGARSGSGGYQRHPGGGLPPDAHLGGAGRRHRHRDPPSGLPHVRAQGGGGGRPGFGGYGYGPHQLPHPPSAQGYNHRAGAEAEAGGGHQSPVDTSAFMLGSGVAPPPRRKKLTTLKKKILMVRAHVRTI